MKKTILFVVTNGAGLGHLTRGLAVARKIHKLDEELEIVFFSTSLATEVIRQEGFMYYYIPTKSMLPKGVSGSVWNNYMRENLDFIVACHKPDVIVFDGGYPYGSVIATLRSNKGIKGVWIKREEYKKNVSTLDQEEKEFMKVIIPKEIGEKYSPYEDVAKGRIYCNPIIMIDENEAYEREALRNAWGVAEDENIFYIQLGAGVINDINSDLGIVLSKVLENPKNRVVLGESIIGNAINIRHERVSIIKQYPNAVYFKGIDYAVSAAGYNTVQELVSFGIPTLFIPNQATKRDDQVARAKLIEGIGAAICLEEVTGESVNNALEYMYLNKNNMINNTSRIEKANGAVMCAKEILNILLER